MDAIQQDVDNKGNTDKVVEISTHESEIERIAEAVSQTVIQDELENQEGERPPVVTEDFSNPLERKGEDWYVNTKVNGENTSVPWEQVVSQYQKNTSADQRLQEASQRQRELADYEEKLNAYRAQLEAQTRQLSATDASEEVSPSSDATDALYEQYHDALFQGDEARASGLLKQIRSADRQPAQQVDVSSIIEQTKAEMREEEKQARERGYEMRRKQAVEMFHSEYPDVAQDTGMLAVADRRSAELYSENPTRDPWDIMQECANYAQDWLKTKVDAMGGGSKEGSRAQRKQNLDEVVPRNVKSHIGDDENEPTYSDIIAEMKQDRGQLA